MKKVLQSILLLSSIVCLQSADAQVMINSVGTPYTQNFDGLSNDTSTTAQTLSLTGWQIFEKGSSAAVDQKYKGSYGTKNAGEVYSYGDTVSTERALGSIASGTNSPSFGVVFQNNTGGNITALSISYVAEHWRSGDTSTTLVDSTIFEYSTTATGIDDTMAAWNSVASLMLNSVNMTTAISGALNGNTAPNFTTKTGLISVLVPNGSKICLRWRDINKAGSDDGLAVDDLTVNFSSTGNPKPSIVSRTPADDVTTVDPVTTTSLVMVFDQNVVVGTGTILLTEVGGSTQPIACSATNISGASVQIPGIVLTAGKQYVVNFDSTCYKTSTGENSYGIYDNTSWNFETKPNSIQNVTKSEIGLFWKSNNQIAFHVPTSENLELHVMDVHGKMLISKRILAKQGENTMPLDMEEFAKGIYIIHLENTKLKGVLKFVKQ